MKTQTIAAVLIFLGLSLITTYLAFADPTGATILSNTSTTASSAGAGSRTDARGTITTLVLDALQQDQNWKGYVGNISGRLTLDNAAGFTLYDWELAGNISGEIYVSRHGSPTFTSLSCANAGNISTEETFFDHTATSSDSISNTYNYTLHDAIPIGGFGTIGADSCPSTATYVNDAQQTMDGTQNFQAVILQDSSDRIIFVTIIDDNSTGYNGNPPTVNSTYDFQLIVPESSINATSTTYYFWTELDG